ncbi:chemotaxis protein CheY [Defluviimonas sp. 20V17]|uniref:Response regulator n=1 Tax=Allgaiera indica TaxID=765699 RepID=A0AAN4ZYN5_9RHOB|nr:response regulator [Allgaiera indica]KDB03886.1 chemotaxis protein CheY [Defluviimonas sp. 20V17]GHE00074.1 response regulator [Allgaiera indica]SDW37655.1 Response regulator receiver domain-containing protein [Allgaiera indica]
MSDLPKILHVEDDPDIREIALMALEVVGGLDVVQCASGAEALERAPGIAPDLLLLDVMMPGMSGDETLTALRKVPQFSETPAIFMTAKAQHSEVDRLKELGALDVITKPFDPMTLADQIISIWQER